MAAEGVPLREPPEELGNPHGGREEGWGEKREGGNESDGWILSFLPNVEKKKTPNVTILPPFQKKRGEKVCGVFFYCSRWLTRIKGGKDSGRKNHSSCCLQSSIPRGEKVNQADVLKVLVHHPSIDNAGNEQAEDKLGSPAVDRVVVLGSVLMAIVEVDTVEDGDILVVEKAWSTLAGCFQ